jgi:hypothetical protein
VGVDARHLRRGVGAQAQGAARELVDQLEGLQAQRLAGAGEQGFEVLQQRRHHQLIAIAARGIEQPRRSSSMCRASEGRTSAM